MKFKFALLIPLFITGLIGLSSCDDCVGCGPCHGPECGDPDENPVVITIDNRLYDKNNLGSFTGSLSGYPMAGRLAAHKTYKFGFDVKTNADQKITCESSRPESIKFIDHDDGTYSFECGVAGDSIIRIYDVDGVILFRDVLGARKEYSSDNVLDAALKVDHYYSPNALISMNGSIKFAMTSSTEAILVGNSPVEGQVSLYFDLVYNATYVLGGETFYNFAIVNEEDPTPTYFFSSVDIKPTADIVHIYDNDDMLAFVLWASDMADIL